MSGAGRMMAAGAYAPTQRSMDFKGSGKRLLRGWRGRRPP